MYRVQWQSQFSGESGETTVPGDVTDTVLRGLSPETLYQVSVVAVYDHTDSEPLAGQETTDGESLADADKLKQLIFSSSQMKCEKIRAKKYLVKVKINMRLYKTSDEPRLALTSTKRKHALAQSELTAG